MGAMRRARRVLPVRPGEPGTRAWGEVLVSATLGYPRYLNGPDGALYWSAYRDHDERDGGPCGARTYASVFAAVAAVTAAVGMIRLPAGWRIDEEPDGAADAPDILDATPDAAIAAPDN